jgi:hypothetical protein
MEQRDLWLERGRAFFVQLFDSFAAPPVAVQPSVWYSGLGIEPLEFTEQLARLQTSLSFAGTIAPDETPMPGSYETNDQAARVAN